MTARPPLAVYPASLGRRVGAFAIDIAVVYAIAGVLLGIVAAIVFGVGPAWDSQSLALMILVSYLLVGVALFAWWLVYSAMQGGRGSIGQRLLGLRLHDASAPEPIGFWRAVLRNLVFGLLGSVVIGYFTPLFDSSGRRQGWHDMAAKAIMIDRKATDAAASVPAPLAPVPTANPYLPPPTGAPELPTPQPAPAAAFAAPGGVATAPAARPAGVPARGMISQVPGARPTPVPDATAPLRSSAHDLTAGNTTTTPFPPASTTEPLFPSAAARAQTPVPASFAAAAPAVAPATAAAPASAPDDDIDATRLTAAVPPPAQRAALYPDAPVIAVLTWDDGTRMAVYGRTLYGRNPANEDGAVAIAVRDETLSLSKTHFEIGGDSAAAWIVDRHSTNGTVLLRDGGRIPLVAGMQTTLRAGDRLEFGDRSVGVGSA